MKTINSELGRVYIEFKEKGNWQDIRNVQRVCIDHIVTITTSEEIVLITMENVNMLKLELADRVIVDNQLNKEPDNGTV